MDSNTSQCDDISLREMAAILALHWKKIVFFSLTASALSYAYFFRHVELQKATMVMDESKYEISYDPESLSPEGQHMLLATSTGFVARVVGKMTAAGLPSNGNHAFLPTFQVIQQTHPSRMVFITARAVNAEDALKGLRIWMREYRDGARRYRARRLLLDHENLFRNQSSQSMLRQAVLEEFIRHHQQSPAGQAHPTIQEAAVHNKMIELQEEIVESMFDRDMANEMVAQLTQLSEPGKVEAISTTNTCTAAARAHALHLTELGKDQLFSMPICKPTPDRDVAKAILVLMIALCFSSAGVLFACRAPTKPQR